MVEQRLSLSEGLLVDVYRNLHKHCWSVRAACGSHRGRVIGHAKSVLLRYCTFHISDSGRLRAIREGRKNVHAHVRGRLLRYDLDHMDRFDFARDSVGASYNICLPHFMTYECKPVVKASHVLAAESGRLLFKPTDKNILDIEDTQKQIRKLFWLTNDSTFV